MCRFVRGAFSRSAQGSEERWQCLYRQWQCTEQLWKWAKSTDFQSCSFDPCRPIFKREGESESESESSSKSIFNLADSLPAARSEDMG